MNQKMRSFGKEILQGNIEVNPYELKGQSACTYCAYKSICGFDPSISGFHKRELEKLGEDEVLTSLRENK